MTNQELLIKNIESVVHTHVVLFRFFRRLRNTNTSQFIRIVVYIMRY